MVSKSALAIVVKNCVAILLFNFSWFRSKYIQFEYVPAQIRHKFKESLLRVPFNHKAQMCDWHFTGGGSWNPPEAASF